MNGLPQPVRLFDAARAPNPRRVRIFLAEKGLEVPVHDLAIMQGEHFADEHVRRIGTHHVPALELSNGTILTETVAICRYIEGLRPEPPLMGRDPLAAAVIEMWQRRVEFQLLMPIGFVLRHGNPAMQVLEHVQCREWAEANRPRVLEGLNWLNARLEVSDYIAGEDFSIADITGIVAVDFMRAIRQQMPETCPALARWAERVRARPGCVA